MNAGDHIRRVAGHGGAVILMVLDEIDRIRKAKIDQPRLFIVESLKNPNEIDVLDSVFARNYYTVAVYSTKEERLQHLARLFAGGLRRPSSDTFRIQATSVMAEDENRHPEDLSQNVLNTYPKGDFFVQNDTSISTSIERFVDLLFGNPFRTPTKDETAMNAARVAALRSCDLSRQVGAAITDLNGTLIASGCNEMPYPGGGIFYEDRHGAIDNRDHVSGGDPNQSEIGETIFDFLSKLKTVGLVDATVDPDVLMNRILVGDLRDKFLDSRIRNLIEFGRVVHAEMHAICEAAALGKSIISSTLYSTTFPCHNCANHIIAAGISEVVYIEPYPKSLTTQLYKNEIVAEQTSRHSKCAVYFRPFTGVSPVLYRRFFQSKKRKMPNGRKVEWSIATATPVQAVAGYADRDRMAECIKGLKELRKRLSLVKFDPAVLL